MLVRNRLVDTVLKDKDLQRTFDWNEETVQYKGQRHICKNIKEWAELSRRDGAWGDNSVIQIFADITGLIVHVIPTEFLTVTNVRHYIPKKDSFDEASITIVHGNNHFQILATTQLPYSISVTVTDTPDVAPVIDLDMEDEVDVNVKLPRQKWPMFKRKSQKVKKNLNIGSDESEDNLPLSTRKKMKKDSASKTRRKEADTIEDTFKDELLGGVQLSPDTEFKDEECGSRDPFASTPEQKVLMITKNMTVATKLCHPDLGKLDKSGRAAHKQTGRCRSEWFERTDENGNLVRSYLRPVDGKPDMVYC